MLSITDHGTALLERRRTERATRLAGPLADLDDEDLARIAAALPALARLAGVLQH